MKFWRHAPYARFNGRDRPYSFRERAAERQGFFVNYICRVPVFMARKVDWRMRKPHNTGKTHA